MEKKQPLLLVLALIVFGVALASAIGIFSRKNITAHRDEMLSEITQIAADAYQFRHRPRSIDGGGGSYTGYRIPEKLKANDHAEFAVAESAGVQLRIVGTSTHGLGSVAVDVDNEGTLKEINYDGEFGSEL